MTSASSRFDENAFCNGGLRCCFDGGKQKRFLVFFCNSQKFQGIFMHEIAVYTCQNTNMKKKKFISQFSFKTTLLSFAVIMYVTMYSSYQSIQSLANTTTMQSQCNHYASTMSQLQAFTLYRFYKHVITQCKHYVTVTSIHSMSFLQGCNHTMQTLCPSYKHSLYVAFTSM